jgi:hypothetical protein
MKGRDEAIINYGSISVWANGDRRLIADHRKGQLFQKSIKLQFE